MRFLRNRQANYRRNSARDSCVTDKHLHKKQYTRLLRNRPTNQRRNGARDFGVTDKQTTEETVHEILA